LRSAEDLTDCHEDSEEIVHFQPSNDQRSLQDLIDCQEGSGRFPNGQMGKGTELRSAEDLKHCQGEEKRKLCIASWAMKGDQMRISKTVKRAVEASQIARWAEMKNWNHLKVSWTWKGVQFSKEC
jgi:hypothetical protein